MAWASTLMCQLVVLILLAGAPLHAQQQRVPHVGMLNYAGPADVRAKQFSEGCMPPINSSRRSIPERIAARQISPFVAFPSRCSTTFAVPSLLATAT